MDTATLKRIPLFADASDEDLKAIATFAEQTTVAEGKILAKEGSFSHEFYAIEDGTAKVVRGDEEIAELGPGDYFGEGLVSHERRNASVVATSSMRLITLSHWEIKRMEKKLPQIVEKIRQAQEERSAN